MPQEVQEAALIDSLCQRYHALPEAGGVMDQPTWFLRNLILLAEAGELTAADPFGGVGVSVDTPTTTHQDDPLAGIPMTVLDG